MRYAARMGPTLCLLHAPRLNLADGAAHALTRKDAALLAIVAVEGPSPPARLAALLWPDASAKQARTNLRQRLLRLRRTAGIPIALSDDSIRLVGELPIDLAAAPQAIVDDPQACAGELLGGHDYLDVDGLNDWVRSAREAWRHRRLELLAAQASRLESNGELARALLYAQRIVADEPVLEHGYRRLMRLHYLRGDRAAALASYERCVEILHRELGSAPNDETREQAALIAEAVGTPAGPARPMPDALRRPPQRVGREAAWHALHELAQRPAALLLVGDAGMGKSRLIGDFCQARTNWCISVARAGDDSAPYALAARLLHALCVQRGLPALHPAHLAVLARLVPTLGTPGSGTLEAASLRIATEQALAHWAAGGLEGVVIDDVHFADAASLELLLPLAGAAGQTGLCWLLAVRPAEMPAALTTWIERQRAPGFASVPLAALDAADVQALLESLRLGFDAPALWAQRLLAHCGGNPLYLLATLGEMQVREPGAFTTPPTELPLPRTLTPLLEGRLRQVSARAVQVAQVAALAAQNFDVELVAAVLECGVTALVEPWRQLEEANVFGPEGYSHALVRDAVVQGIPVVLQRALHLRIARWLSAHDAPPGRVAGHLWNAQAWGEAAAAYERAAQGALQLSRREDELDMLRRAALAHQHAGAADAAFACRWRAAHSMLVADAVQQALAEANALLASAADPAQRRLALEARAAVYNELTEGDKALADVTEARAIAIAGGVDATLQVALARRETIALLRLNRNAQALEAISAVREAALALSDVDQRLGWRCDLASALDYNDRLEEAVLAFKEIANDAEATQRWSQVADAAGNLSVTLMHLGRAAESRQHSERAVAVGHRYAGPGGGVLIDEMTLAGTLSDMGHFRAALELGTRVAEAMRNGGHLAWAANAENDLARVYLWLGRGDLAMQAMRPLPADAPETTRGMRLFTQARVAYATGRPDRERFEEAARLLSAAGRSYVHVRIGLERARFAEPVECAARSAELEAAARGMQQFGLVGMALSLQVDALREAGQLQAAADAARALLAHLQHVDPIALYPPQPWWSAVQALDAAGDEAAALSALAHAAGWVRATAREHVPELFRSSFLDRNPTNRAVLTAAARRLAG